MLKEKLYNDNVTGPNILNII